MPANRGKQKQLQKQKKRREAARKQQNARQASALLPRSKQALLQRAQTLPHGPSFISRTWREGDESSPSLLMVMVTRRAPGGLLVPASAVVDRTCLGVKDGFLGRPLTEPELDDYRKHLAERGEILEPCELLVAQSVVFHALDYAHSLGFAPHRDFPAVLFGPRPERLLDTPLAKPSRPVYISGPYDDVPKVLEQLRRVAGTSFSVVAGGSMERLDQPGMSVGEEEGDDEDEEPEDEGEEDEATPAGP